MSTEVHACNKCGRLHYENGRPAVNNEGDPAMLVGEEKALFVRGVPFSEKNPN